MNINEFVNRCEKPRVKRWVETVVKNKINSENPPSYQEIEHIIDFFESEDGPISVKQISWEQAKQKTEEWVQNLNRKAGEVVETEEDTEFVFQPSNSNLKWVKLVGKAAFEREGKLMRHCIASYHGKSGSDNYSLRDSLNKPHATVEIIKDDEGRVNQIKGKGNGPIHPKYISAVIEFMNFINLPIREHDLPNLGYVDLPDIGWDIIEKKTLGYKYAMINNKKYLYIHN